MRLLPNRNDLLQGVAGFAVLFVVAFPLAVFHDVAVNDNELGDALAFGVRAALMYGVLGTVIGFGWSWASDNDEEPPALPQGALRGGQSVALTPEERAEAIAYCGFREPTPIGDLRAVHAFTVLAFSLVGFGIFGVVFGDDGGQRGTALLMLLVGLPCCWGLWSVTTDAPQRPPTTRTSAQRSTAPQGTPRAALAAHLPLVTSAPGRQKLNQAGCASPVLLMSGPSEGGPGEFQAGPSAYRGFRKARPFFAVTAAVSLRPSWSSKASPS